jgi:tRNA(fMet)-specific endonuclease VapC
LDYLLDTNACIALINLRDNPVRKRYQNASRSGRRVFISSIVTFELWYGVAKSTRLTWNTERLETFLAGQNAMLPFDAEDALSAGLIRADLELAGRMIGPYDLLIAGQALARQLTLVTVNVSEFSRVKGLKWQDWAKP